MLLANVTASPDYFVSSVNTLDSFWEPTVEYGPQLSSYSGLVKEKSKVSALAWKHVRTIFKARAENCIFSLDRSYVSLMNGGRGARRCIGGEVTHAFFPNRTTALVRLTVVSLVFAMPKVVSVHSYRGGTGKSNFTANLATTVAAQGYRVGVVDTDLPSPGIHNLFCLEPEQTQKALNHYLWGECPIEAVAYDVSANVGINGGSGQLFLVPASVKADDIARILNDGYDVRLMNDGFRSLVKALQLDYLFIDTHPGLSKETFLSIAISHVLLLILRPDKQDY